MSDVLSQNQIDALLQSMMDSGSEEEDTKKEPEKKVRKYDFYSPKKFTKDKLRILRDVFEKYTRIASSMINSLFRISCDTEVLAIEEQRYYEFANALRDSDVVASVSVKLQDEWVVKPVLFHITPGLMLGFMDRMMGGNGSNAEDEEDEYVYTDIERALYGNITKYISEGLGDAWDTYVNMDFRYDEIEDNPNMLPVIGLDETVVIMALEVKMDYGGGRISVCFPGDLLSDIFAVYDKKTNKEKAVVYIDNSKDIMESLRKSELEVSVKLGEAQVRMQDLYNLRPGDVINLNKPKNSEVVVSVANSKWYKGWLGQQNNKVAVMIDGIYGEDTEIEEDEIDTRPNEEGQEPLLAAGEQ